VENLINDLDDEALAKWADSLYRACDAHKIGAPYVVRLAAGTNKKTADALRSRGFIVLYPGEFLDKLPWDLSAAGC
jgi:hypothetical protein